MIFWTLQVVFQCVYNKEVRVSEQLDVHVFGLSLYKLEKNRSRGKGERTMNFFSSGGIKKGFVGVSP